MANPYETRRYLDEYLLFHYGKADELCPFETIPRDLLRFHERIRKECTLPMKLTGRACSPLRALPQETIRALDVGCAVGRFTFELAQVANEVTGVDNSRSFIAAARNLARKGSAHVRVPESGDQFVRRKIVRPKISRSSKLRFEVGDAMKLQDLPRASYQIIAAINLLCRLPSPLRFLRQLPGLVAPGGQLIIASPFSWLGNFTPRREWLSPQAVVKILSPHFHLVRQRDLPFLIREHRRKYQLVISHVMTFVRQA